mgnify:FL=1
MLDGRVVHCSIVDLGELDIEIRVSETGWVHLPFNHEEACSLFGPATRVVEYYDPSEDPRSP